MLLLLVINLLLSLPYIIPQYHYLIIYAFILLLIDDWVISTFELLKTVLLRDIYSSGTE